MSLCDYVYTMARLLNKSQQGCGHYLTGIAELFMSKWIRSSREDFVIFQLFLKNDKVFLTSAANESAEG